MKNVTMSRSRLSDRNGANRAASVSLGAHCEGLAFQYYDFPLVSILITAHGNLPLTARCLRAVAASGIVIPHEVMVAEDNSGDPEMEELVAIQGLRYFSRPRNLGYIGNANKLAAQARGTYVALLNNDTMVQPGWLEALLSVFDRYPDCGAAGSLLLFPDGRIQEAGAIVWSNAKCMNYGRGESPLKPDYSFTRAVDYVSAASLLIRKSVFLSSGGFDEIFAPAYYEDTDLAFRLRSRGLQIYFEPRSRVFHDEGGSYGKTWASRAKRRQWINRFKFRARWRRALKEQCRATPENIRFASDRLSSNGNVGIFVEDGFQGGQEFAICLAQALRRAGYPVRLSLHETCENLELLARAGIEVHENADEKEHSGGINFFSEPSTVFFYVTQKNCWPAGREGREEIDSLVTPDGKGAWKFRFGRAQSLVVKAAELEANRPEAVGIIATLTERLIAMARSVK